MGASTRAEAVREAKNTSGYRPSGMCQQFTRTCFDIGGGFGSARAAWFGAMKRHHTSNASSIPAGVPVYWLGGSRGYGHAAVSLGNGLVRSTDWPRTYSVGTARINDITRQWGMSLVGWCEDINGTKIPGMPGSVEAKPKINLKHVVGATKNGTEIYHGKRLKAALVKKVGKGKMNLASPVLGKAFREQYKKLQVKFLKEHHQEVTKANANGIPGKETLTWLGFDVV